MSSRKAILRLLAVGITSTTLLSFSGVAAKAASFNLSYQFSNGTSLSAMLEGEVDEDDQNVVSIDSLESASLSDGNGDALSFESGELAFAPATLTFDGGFAALSTGSIGTNAPDATGFSIFNNLVFEGQDFSFVDLVYQSSQGNNIRLSEAFSYGAYSFGKADIPENSSVAVFLTALAGMGLMVAKRNHVEKSA